MNVYFFNKKNQYNESQLRSKTTGEVLRLNKALKKPNFTKQPPRPKDPDKFKIFTRH